MSEEKPKYATEPPRLNAAVAVALLRRLEFSGKAGACPECTGLAHANFCTLARLIRQIEADDIEAVRLRRALHEIARINGTGGFDYNGPIQRIAREALEEKR